MEAKSIEEILDTVKEIVSSAPNISQDDSSILPKSISPLPKWACTLPEGSLPLQRSVEKLKSAVIPYLNASSLSPRYYGFVTGGITPAARIADALVSIYDQNVSVHLPDETIATDVEVAALNMLVDLFQLPKQEWSVGTEGQGGGTFTTGATASNVLGLALGREYVLTEAARRATGKQMSVGDHGMLAVAYAAQIDRVQVLSTLPHSSIAKAASIVGIGRSNVKSIIKKGSDLAIDIEQLQSLAEDAAAERTAYILAISTGEVNTGRFASDSMDMMQKVRGICDKYGIWIHVDGAFGLFGRILMNHSKAHEYRNVVDGVRGVELADSITSDGHKLLNVPYDCGMFFTRHKSLSEASCMNGNAAYLKSSGGASSVQSPLNIGIENSRRFRALPVYATLSAYGREGYSDLLIRQISLARRVAAWIWGNDAYELLPRSESQDIAISKTFMIVLFRAKDETLNEKLVQMIKDTGKIYVSGTQWDGRSAARIAVSNWQVDIERDLKTVERVLQSVLEGWKEIAF